MHDIFISYAHLDDDSPTGREDGWVTTLKHWLETALKTPLGRKPDIWMDYQLVANAQVTPTLLEEVRGCRALVLVLSPGYQNSEWCQRELINFLAKTPPSGNREAVFIIEKYPVKRETLHKRLQELTPVQFWEPGLDNKVPRILGWPEPDKDEHNPYWAKINYLANLLADHVRNAVTTVLQLPPDVAEQEKNTAAAQVVWLAEPTPKLADYWDQLAGSIRRRGGIVRPSARDAYPLTSAQQLTEAISKDMEGAKLLIQLIGDESGQQIPGAAGTLATIQHAAAKELQQSGSGQKYLRWRPPEVDLNQITDPDLGEILFGATRCGFEQFRQQVLETLDQLKPPPAAKPGGSMTICLTAGERDQPLCDELSSILQDLGWEVVSPPAKPTEGDSAQTFRENVDEIMHMSDAVILVYGKESPAWIQAQYMRASKLMGNMGKLPVLIEGPPEEKPALQISSRTILGRTLNCRNGIKRDEVADFIRQLGVDRDG